ncbi:4799_t:CDS:1, partial [Funneliformis geosporum]
PSNMNSYSYENSLSKPSYTDTLRNNNNQSENKNTPVQHKPTQHNNTPVPDQTGLNRIMDSLSKLE